MKKGARSSGTVCSELQGITTQNTIFFIGTSVRTSNPTEWEVLLIKCKSKFASCQRSQQTTNRSQWWCYFSVSWSVLLSAVMNTRKCVKYQKLYMCWCLYIEAKPWMKVPANMFFFFLTRGAGFDSNERHINVHLNGKFRLHSHNGTTSTNVYSAGHIFISVLYIELCEFQIFWRFVVCYELCKPI